MTEQVYIYSLLEPTDILRVGNQKRHTPVFIEKWKGIQELIDEIGIEEYKKKIAEDEQREKENYFY